MALPTVVMALDVSDNAPAVTMLDSSAGDSFRVEFLQTAAPIKTELGRIEAPRLLLCPEFWKASS